MRVLMVLVLAIACETPAAMAQPRCPAGEGAVTVEAGALTLAALVAPATVIRREQKPMTFALHGLIEFNSLAELFPYVDGQAGRWKFPTAQARQEFADGLLRRGVESRVVSMVDEKPLEVLLTHTEAELAAQIECLPAVLFAGKHWRLERSGYRQAFERVRGRWSKGLNCWSASPSISGRVLSNWYTIEEGIELYGAAYDSTEHFWQAVKYHPSVTVADLLGLLSKVDAVDWTGWLARLDREQNVYLEHSYAIEFLRANLRAEHRAWFRAQLEAQPRQSRARALQQREPGTMRFTGLQEKVLWGDLADVFHLLVALDARVPVGDAKLMEALRAQRFDAVYLGERKLGFISPEFRGLMLEIWKVKFLRMERFRQVIRSIPREVRLEHFLNDGDSPDIPIPVYIGYLNQIREMAWEGGGR